MEKIESIQIEVTQLRKNKKGGIPRIILWITAVMASAIFILGAFQDYCGIHMHFVFDRYIMMLPLLLFTFLQLRKKKVPLVLETNGHNLSILSQSGKSLYNSQQKGMEIIEHKEKDRLYLLVEGKKPGKTQKIEIVFEKERELRLIQSLGILLNDKRD